MPHDIAVEVPAGGTLGVLGPTGSGKTTLLRCISRLYNPPPGTVFIDGQDVRGIDLDGWRRAMQLVEQGRLDLDADVNDYLREVKVEPGFDGPGIPGEQHAA